MSKSLFIAEKPSVAREFAKALNESFSNRDGYMESGSYVVTWCVGHLVTMSYPEAYDEKYKKWRLDTLPFIPHEFKYEVIKTSKKQYDTVAGQLRRADVSVIYVCTDSGREGEYIYRLVDQMAKVSGKEKKRVWIDSQTEEEILKGIKTAKDLSEYDNLSASAYLRAKEDYLMGINFSRLLTLKYGNTIAGLLGQKYVSISAGRVMTCVLGMVVRREREIRDFVKTPFYRVTVSLQLPAPAPAAEKTMPAAGGSPSDNVPEGGTAGGAELNFDAERKQTADVCAGSGGALRERQIEGEWKAVSGSKYFESPKLYKENGFKEKADAAALIRSLKEIEPQMARVVSIEKKKEKKNAPLLYNLAELQNDCARMFKISPDETLKIVQELYEKKLVTYPRTDARVISSAVAKEIDKNIRGLCDIRAVQGFADEILSSGRYRNIAKTRYVNDKMITDHYAIIPTGQGIGAMKGLKPTALKVYETIVRRFLAIFYEPAVYRKITLVTGIEKEQISADTCGDLKCQTPPDAGGGMKAQALSNAGEIGKEQFFSNFKFLEEQGYLKVMKYTFEKNKSSDGDSSALLAAVSALKRGDMLPVSGYDIKEGETSPPKRYNSGSMILAMENAGQLIEDEELRAQIKGSGIGTSATRADILKKLVNNKYLSLSKKTQIITPTLLGELIYESVDASVRSLLDPALTASWEKGLTMVAEGEISSDEYMQKLEGFIRRRSDVIIRASNQGRVKEAYGRIKGYYKNPAGRKK